MSSCINCKYFMLFSILDRPPDPEFGICFLINREPVSRSGWSQSCSKYEPKKNKQIRYKTYMEYMKSIIKE